MKKYQNYIIGAVILIVGFGAGWIFKPSSSLNQDSTEMAHDHEMAGAESSGAEEIWTCSMHPQIRQNEPGICPICEMDLIPLDNSFSNDDPAVLQMSLEATKLAQIETTIVGGESSGMKMSSKTSDVLVDGTIELDQRSINSQTAHIGGRLESMLINFEGDYVKAGQKIATVYSTDLLAASQELLTAAQFEDKVEGIKAASIQKLKNWKITDAQIEQILSTGKPIETIDLFADHSGYVMSKKVSQGDYVKTGQALYTVGRTGRLWLIFNVFESDLGRIRKGQQVTFTTPSLGQKEMTARITYIDPLLNANSRTGSIRAEINNSGNQLKPGMLLKGKIKASTGIKTNKQTVTIPKSALLWTGDKSVVYVKMEDMEVPSFKFREVTVGSQSGNQVIILNGLENGEEIVTHGAFSIDAAAQLNNNTSMMNRNVSLKSDASPDMVPDYVESTPATFKTQLTTLAQAYIPLKDAFVATDAMAAKTAAQSFLAATEQVDMSSVLGEAHLFWMEQLDVLKIHGQKITELEDVEDQRKQFGFVSQAMIKSIKSFGIAGETLYVQYCPMAFNNKGADWISNQTGIQNPYFGDKMMKCGSVKDTLNF